jgi:hypothetical protein
MEVPQSYSHQGNPKLDQTRYTTKTRDHEFVDSKVVKFLSKVYDFMKKKEM